MSGPADLLATQLTAAKNMTHTLALPESATLRIGHFNGDAPDQPPAWDPMLLPEAPTDSPPEPCGKDERGYVSDRVGQCVSPAPATRASGYWMASEMVSPEPATEPRLRRGPDRQDACPTLGTGGIAPAEAPELGQARRIISAAVEKLRPRLDQSARQC